MKTALNRQLISFFSNFDTKAFVLQSIDSSQEFQSNEYNNKKKCYTFIKVSNKYILNLKILNFFIPV